VSDFIARPAAGGAPEGGGGPWNGGAPPPVLMAALGAAAVIAVTLFALLGRFGGGDEDQAAPVRDADPASAGAAAQRQRVQLTVTLLGGGDGVVQIQPGDIACIKPCEHEFDRGTRVTVAADPGSGSTFAGWEDVCDAAAGRCSILMNDDKALGATFDSKPAAPVELCDDAATAAVDPACEEETRDPGDEQLDPPPAADCADGRDNDRDGLTDSAQDPNCAGGGAEAGSAAPGTTASPVAPPPPVPNDCSDGRDNDRDGLTDRAQDPNCVGGRSESG
jgi:hypothetical protein